MSLSIYNKFAKGFRNNSSGTQMTWWKTNFNMPVPNIFDDNSNYQKTTGMLTALEEGTVFDLTGFRQGWELIAAASTFAIDGPYSNGTINLYQEWKKPDGTVMFTNGPYIWNPGDVPSGYWQGYQIVSNQGVAPWEVDVSGTYKCRVYTTGGISQSQDFNVTFNNVPAYSGYKTPGYLWINGNKLEYTSANGFAHSIEGTKLTTLEESSRYGYVWTEENDTRLFYGASDGQIYTPQLNIKQFASSFSNGAPGTVSGKQPGYIYADNQFGWTHLSHIAGDGYKYLIGDGHNPYINPY